MNTPMRILTGRLFWFLSVNSDLPGGEGLGNFCHTQQDRLEPSKSKLTFDIHESGEIL